MIEIVFGVLGLVMLVSGKLPQNLFQMLFGKGVYDAPAATARKFGLLLLTPAPLIFLGIVLAMVVLGGEPEPYVPWVEVIVLCTVAVLSLLWARKLHQDLPPEPPKPPAIPEPLLRAIVNDGRKSSPTRRPLVVVITMIVLMLLPFVFLGLIQSSASDLGIALDWNRYAFMIIIGTGAVAVLIMFTLLLKRRRDASRSEMPVPPVTPIVEETPKDVFELSDHEIRQKLGLEPPDLVAAVPPPPPDPAEIKRWKAKRALVMVIGLLAGLFLPLIMFLAYATDESSPRSLQDQVTIYTIIASSLILGVVLIVFFARQTRKK
jgi:hypothetical protein